MLSQSQQHRTIIDRSTLTLLEHININIPSHEEYASFFFDILGCAYDPRRCEFGTAKKTLWANCGASQFHLPYGEKAQSIPGKIGLRYDSLENLKHRIITRRKDEQQQLAAEIQNDCVRLKDRAGNVYECRTGGNPVATPQWQQPTIRTNQQQQQQPDCRGIAYVEFHCPVGTAETIALFYDTVFDATTSVLPQNDINDATPLQVAVIGFGNIDSTGKADQALVFREIASPIPPYDGHHIALYVGESAKDFEQAFRNAELANIVWVNPRFSDKASNLQGAKKWKQFRFKDIVDMRTGQKVFELEHEIRSMEHDAWPGRAREG